MAESQKLHPATLVTNIKQHVPVVLDYAGAEYNNWATLFKLHCRAYLVIDHITPAEDATPLTDPSAKALWQRLDDIVRQWIYGTISNDLLNSILDADDKAIDTWNRLENFFHNNKSVRALTLDSQFTNTLLEHFDGVKSYCTRLKTLADSLKNVGDPISDHRMALQLLKGLSDEYKAFRTSVRHLKPLPSFDELRSMLELEEQSNVSDLAVEVCARPISRSLLVLLRSWTVRPLLGEASHVGVVEGLVRARVAARAKVTPTPKAPTRTRTIRSNPVMLLYPCNNNFIIVRVGPFLLHGLIGLKLHGQPLHAHTPLKGQAQIRGLLLVLGFPLHSPVFLGLAPNRLISLLIEQMVQHLTCPLILNKQCIQCPSMIRHTIWIQVQPLI
ncbi:Retrovirus-related Pol polyprotein from transposon TNT 1-94 [Bienertia sinuspersici]